MVKKFLGIAGLSVALLAPPSYADFNAGFDAYNKGDYATALKKLTPLAEQGHAIAQNNLGQMYRYSLGVRQDDQKAMEWYTKAALQGHAGAQFRLGFMYDSSQGVRQDYQKAVKWYTKTALQGNTFAQNRLGFMYAIGQGVRQSDATAKEWFGKACDNGQQVGCKNYAILNRR